MLVRPTYLCGDMFLRCRLSLSVTLSLNLAAPVCVRHFVGVTFFELCSFVAFHEDLSFGCFQSQRLATKLGDDYVEGKQPLQGAYAV